MPWLWNSWEEYVATVQPVALNSPGRFRLADRRSRFVTAGRFYEAVARLTSAIESLRKLGFTGDNHRLLPKDPAISADAKAFVLDLVDSGEELLLYADAQARYEFIRAYLDHKVPTQQRRDVVQKILQYVGYRTFLDSGMHRPFRTWDELESTNGIAPLSRAAAPRKTKQDSELSLSGINHLIEAVCLLAI